MAATGITLCLRDGEDVISKMHPLDVAENILKNSFGGANVSKWYLPDDSKYTVIAGELVLRAVKKSK